jgi:hypothetical protein
MNVHSKRNSDLVMTTLSFNIDIKSALVGVLTPSSLSSGLKIY